MNVHENAAVQEAIAIIDARVYGPQTAVVRVTQRHIDRGIQGDCHLCPVALALNEAFPEYDFLVGVTDFDVYAKRVPGKSMHYLRLPSDVSNWIRQFDNSSKAERQKYTRPISFEVTL